MNPYKIPIYKTSGAVQAPSSSVLKTAQEEEEERKRAEKSKSGGGVGAGLVGAGIASALGGGESVAAPEIVSASRIPVAAAASEAAGVGTAAETAGTAGAVAAEVAGPWAELGSGLGIGETAGSALGVAGGVAGGILAIHQAPKAIEAAQAGDVAGATTHGALAGAGSGMAIGAFFGPVGMAVGVAIGAGAGGLGGAIGGLSGSGKDEDQQGRDKVRAAMQASGFVDGAYSVELADGTRYDIGGDGHAKNFDNSGYAYQVARDHPYSVQAVGWADTLASALTGGNKKLRTDFAGYLANAAMSNADNIETVRANILHMIDKAGLTRQQMESVFGELYKNKAIDEATLQSFNRSLDSLFSGDSAQYVRKSWAEMEQATGIQTDQSPTSVTPPALVPNAPTGAPTTVGQAIAPQQTRVPVANNIAAQLSQATQLPPATIKQAPGVATPEAVAPNPTPRPTIGNPGRNAAFIISQQLQKLPGRTYGYD